MLHHGAHISQIADGVKRGGNTVFWVVWNFERGVFNISPSGSIVHHPFVKSSTLSGFFAFLTRRQIAKRIIDKNADDVLVALRKPCLIEWIYRLPSDAAPSTCCLFHSYRECAGEDAGRMAGEAYGSSQTHTATVPAASVSLPQKRRKPFLILPRSRRRPPQVLPCADGASCLDKRQRVARLGSL